MKQAWSGTPQGVRFRTLLILDSIVYKTTNIDFSKQLAATEARLFHSLWNSYTRRSKKAVRAAISSLPTAPATKPDIGKFLKSLAEEFVGWPAEMRPTVSAVVDEVYTTGKTVGYKRGTGQAAQPLVDNSSQRTTKTVAVDPNFTLLDDQAIQAITEQQVYWIGRHYTANLSKRIAAIVKDRLLNSGLSHREAAESLEKALSAEFGYNASSESSIAALELPGGWKGSGLQYLDGLATNTVTVARNQGNIRGLHESGITSYVIINPGGERECERCIYLEQESQKHAFVVNDALSKMDLEISARSPEDVRRLHPWASSVKELKASHNLQGDGYGFPPFHFKCRCSVDLHESSTFTLPAA